MKKILTVAAMSALTLIFTTGCVSSSQNMAPKGAEDSAIYKSEASANAIHVNSHNIEKVMRSVKNAGEKAGWIMTPFKINEFIAEKVTDNKTISTEIELHNEYISFSEDKASKSELSGLINAIEKELNKEPAAH